MSITHVVIYRDRFYVTKYIHIEKKPHPIKIHNLKAQFKLTR